jgi:hypothetical protein
MRLGLPATSTNKLQVAFSLDTSIFKCEEFYDCVGRDPYFDKAVMRMVVNIYSEVLSRQATETIPEEGVAEDGAVEDGAVEDGAVEDGAVEDGAVEDGAVEDGAVEDGAVEDGVAEKCGAAEDGAVDEGAVEEPVNLGIPPQPSGPARSFGWDHWTLRSKLGASFSGNSQLEFEKDTNSLYPENKLRSQAGKVLVTNGSNPKRRKTRRRKKAIKIRTWIKRKRRWKNWQSQRRSCEP